MNSKTIISLVVLIFITGFVFSQEKNENTEFNQYNSSVFNSKENSLFIVSTMSNEKLSIGNSQENNVNILQVGELNSINVNVVSENSSLFLKQNGYNNSINFNKKAPEITQSLIQMGNNNLISDYTYYTNYSVNMEVIQNGDNQNVQNIGTNSMSKDMKISQTGNGASVIIINQ